MKKKNSCLRKHARNILNLEKKKMLPLTKEELKLNRDATDCYIPGKRFLKKLDSFKNKKYHKVRDNCHCAGNIEDSIQRCST